MVKDTEVRKDEHSDESCSYSYEGCQYGGSMCCPMMYSCPMYGGMPYYGQQVMRDEDENDDMFRHRRRHHRRNCCYPTSCYTCPNPCYMRPRPNPCYGRPTPY